MDVEGVRNGSKTRLVDFKLVDAISKMLNVQVALIVGRKRDSIVIGGAREVDGGFDASPR